MKVQCPVCRKMKVISPRRPVTKISTVCFYCGRHFKVYRSQKDNQVVEW